MLRKVFHYFGYTLIIVKNSDANSRLKARALFGKMAAGTRLTGKGGSVYSTLGDQTREGGNTAGGSNDKQNP